MELSLWSQRLDFAMIYFCPWSYASVAALQSRFLALIWIRPLSSSSVSACTPRHSSKTDIFLFVLFPFKDTHPHPRAFVFGGIHLAHQQRAFANRSGLYWYYLISIGYACFGAVNPPTCPHAVNILWKRVLETLLSETETDCEDASV